MKNKTKLLFLAVNVLALSTFVACSSDGGGGGKAKPKNNTGSNQNDQSRGSGKAVEPGQEQAGDPQFSYSFKDTKNNCSISLDFYDEQSMCYALLDRDANKACALAQRKIKFKECIQKGIVPAQKFEETSVHLGVYSCEGEIQANVDSSIISKDLNSETEWNGIDDKIIKIEELISDKSKNTISVFSHLISTKPNAKARQVLMATALDKSLTLEMQSTPSAQMQIKYSNTKKHIQNLDIMCAKATTVLANEEAAKAQSAKTNIQSAKEQVRANSAKAKSMPNDRRKAKSSAPSPRMQLNPEEASYLADSRSQGSGRDARLNTKPRLTKEERQAMEQEAAQQARPTQVAAAPVVSDELNLTCTGFIKLKSHEAVQLKRSNIKFMKNETKIEVLHHNEYYDEGALSVFQKMEDGKSSIGVAVDNLGTDQRTLEASVSNENLFAFNLKLKDEKLEQIVVECAPSELMKNMESEVESVDTNLDVITNEDEISSGGTVVRVAKSLQISQSSSDLNTSGTKISSSESSEPMNTVNTAMPVASSNESSVSKTVRTTRTTRLVEGGKVQSQTTQTTHAAEVSQTAKQNTVKQNSQSPSTQTVSKTVRINGVDLPLASKGQRNYNKNPELEKILNSKPVSSSATVTPVKTSTSNVRKQVVPADAKRGAPVLELDIKAKPRATVSTRAYEVTPKAKVAAPKLNTNTSVQTSKSETVRSSTKTINVNGRSLPSSSQPAGSYTTENTVAIPMRRESKLFEHEPVKKSSVTKKTTSSVRKAPKASNSNLTTAEKAEKIDKDLKEFRRANELSRQRLKQIDEQRQKLKQQAEANRQAQIEQKKMQIKYNIARRASGASSMNNMNSNMNRPMLAMNNMNNRTSFGNSSRPSSR